MGFWDRLKAVGKAVKEFFVGKPAPQPEPAPKPSEERERPSRPREERRKTVEFKVNIGFYSFSDTYTTTRTLEQSENPKDYYSEVLDEAYVYVQENHPTLISTSGRRGSLRMEIGHEEI